MSSECHHVDDHELMANPAGSWVLSMEKLAYTPKDTEFCEVIEETEHSSQQKPEGDSATSLMAGLFPAMKAEAHSAVGAASTEVLRTNV